jgi:hypothetical protein
MCNDQILDQIRAGKARWLRGDIEEFGRTGMQFNHREQVFLPVDPVRECW